MLRQASTSVLYWNIKMYFLPVFLLYIILLFDWYLVFNESFYNLENLFFSLFATMSLFVAVGWVLYAVRYYSLIPGYSKIRKEFFCRIADIGGYQKEGELDNKILYGKRIFEEYRDMLIDNDREVFFERHVGWVFVVYFANTVMLSFLCIIVLSIYLWYDNPVVYIERNMRIILILISIVGVIARKV